MSSSSSGLTVQAQWSLNESGNDIISVATGVLRAATSDNVQPIAILAAEAFGNTLPICQHTQIMMEHLGSRRHTSKVLGFMKASIGFMRHDSAAQLASSQAGVRFLGLAAALIGSDANYFQTARYLESMIRETSHQDQILPTIGQMKDLLVALEPKLACADFANSVFGWDALLYHHSSSTPAFRQSSLKDVLHPSSGEIDALLKAFRSLHRIGDADLGIKQQPRILVIANRHIPWIIAFTKWCLGSPPQVIHVDGIEVIPTMDSLVTLNIAALNESEPNVPALKVSVLYEINDPSQFIQFDPTLFQPQIEAGYVSGMVDIRTFGSRRLRMLNLGAQGNSEQICAMLLFSLTLVRQFLKVNTVNPPEFQDYAFPVWPSPQDTIRSFVEFTGFEASRLPEWPQTSFLELEPVALRRQQLSQQCQCVYCRSGLIDLGPSSDCSVAIYLESLAIVASDIICIALLDHDEEIRLQSPRKFHKPRLDSNLEQKVAELMKDQNRVSLKVESIRNYISNLVGRKSDTTIRSNIGRIMSSECGQVTYPTILDTMSLTGVSLLRVTIVPGCLIYANQHFKVVTSDTRTNYSRDPEIYKAVPVTRPLDLSGSRRIVWETELAEDRLILWMRCDEEREFTGLVAIIYGATASLFISHCPHQENAPLPQADDNAVFISLPRKDIALQYRPVTWVAAVAGNNNMRVLALVADRPAVVRGRACLACCLDICRKVNYRYVIC